MKVVVYNKKGQAAIVEYALTFALILGAVMAMTVYFKRGVQGRFHGANHYAEREIGALFDRQGSAGDPEYDLAGRVIMQYEPYYTERVADRTSRGTVIDRERGQFKTIGIQEKEYQDYVTTMTIQSNQLAPKDAY